METIKQFFIDNQSSIIVSLIIGALFFILGPLGLWFSGKRVKIEKINKAKSEFLDLIESMLVNGENISIPKLSTLFNAIERQNGINLELDSDINNLLEDLSLRFAKSKHLSSEQKDEYANKIDQLINDLKNPKTANNSTDFQRELPKSLKSIINDLKKQSNDPNSKELDKAIEQLEKYFDNPSDPFLRIITLMRDKKFIQYLVITYVIIFIAVLAVKFLIE